MAAVLATTTQVTTNLRRSIFTLSADGDYCDINLTNNEEFASLQTNGISADDILLKFSLDGTNFEQWVDSTGLNPWNASDAISNAIRIAPFVKARIERDGAADGDINGTFNMSK